MQSLKQSLTFFVLFFGILAAVSLAPAKSHAACHCIGSPSSVEAIKDNTSKNGAVCTCLKDNLIGSISSFPWKLPGLTGTIPGASQPKSLVDYFENVYWPRMVAMQQKLGQEQAQTNAANTHTSVQSIDGNNFVNYSQDLSRNRAEVAVNTAGLTDVVCPVATMAGALNALDPIVNLRTYMAIKEATEEMDGSARFPMSANGLVNFYNKMIEQRNSLGLCNPEGNNNVDSQWCTSGKPNIRNADINAMSTDVALSSNETDTENPNSRKFANLYLSNLFGFAFTPLRMDQVQGGKANAVDEILYDRVRFASQVMTFRKPFQKNIESRQAVQGLDANIQKAYEENLKMIGVTPGAEVEKLFKTPDGGWSKLAMEKLFFRDGNVDPSEFSRLASQAALNQTNIMTYQTIKVMHTVAMLYDIREELKETNRLLGALGSMMAVDRHRAIEAKIQGVTAN